MVRSRAALLALTLLLVVAAPAAAIERLPAVAAPVAGNPADRLLAVPIEDSVYDGATHCAPKPKPGMLALQHWLETHVRGVFWGSYRCEMWGKHEASLHAENRAIDWHLDVSVPADRRAARTLIETLLAPDALGNPHALARRMGIEEIIWDCSYWGAGSDQFGPYQPCFGRSGRPRKGVDPTTAHRNHIHLGMSRDGARRRTSYWRVAAR
jgi:hypothetical protein